MSDYSLYKFPPSGVDSGLVIKKELLSASEKLAYLNGIQEKLPNPDLIIDTLPLQEAQDSSAIESIFTTQDELYAASVREGPLHPAIKEVRNYVYGLSLGVENLKPHNLIDNNTIMDIQQAVKGGGRGYRTGEVSIVGAKGRKIYTPPPAAEVADLMGGLVNYINLGDDYHPLIKMAIIHHQFESIHPFTDGNGRTGRIINILYLMKEQKLARAVIYLSRFINHNKRDYYRLLQEVREQGNWEEWIAYMLIAIGDTAVHCTNLINSISQNFLEQKQIIRDNYKFYRQELINHIYRKPYTRRDFLAKELGIALPTAARRLAQLSEGGILEKVGRSPNVYYINKSLRDILFDSPSLELTRPILGSA